MAFRVPRLSITAIALFLLVLALARTSIPRCLALAGPHLVLYVQSTHHFDGRPVSILPLIEEHKSSVTHLVVAAFHINEGSGIRLNDHDPKDPVFATLWAEVELMKVAGVKVMGMVGGAATGSFTPATLDGDDAVFDIYYQQLYEMIKATRLDGIDLDIEEPMSLNGVTRLIRRLRNDFGSDFIITLAPVASALLDDANLSGFSYPALEATVGTDITFYNAQFYSGFGTMSTPNDFRKVIAAGWKPQRIVVGQLTSPNNGYGYIPLSELSQTLNALREEYGKIGGIMGWEYYNSDPGGEEQPQQWIQLVASMLRQYSGHDSTRRLR